jgi:hypothetical protein
MLVMRFEEIHARQVHYSGTVTGRWTHSKPTKDDMDLNSGGEAEPGTRVSLSAFASVHKGHVPPNPMMQVRIMMADHGFAAASMALYPRKTGPELIELLRTWQMFAIKISKGTK